MPWMMPQTFEAGSRANGCGSASQGRRADQPQHQRQQHQAEGRARPEPQQVQVDDRQHPGGQQIPVLVARQRDAAAGGPRGNRGTPSGRANPARRECATSRTPRTALRNISREISSARAMA